MKKIIVSILIILFLISIYKDLTLGTNISNQKDEENETRIISDNSSQFDAVKVKIEQGDTLLTIIERLNPNIDNLNMDQLNTDFLYLNPTADPNQLQLNRFYFFPQYK